MASILSPAERCGHNPPLLTHHASWSSRPGPILGSPSSGGGRGTTRRHTWTWMPGPAVPGGTARHRRKPVMSLWQHGVFREVVAPGAASSSRSCGRRERARHRDPRHHHVRRRGWQNPPHAAADALPIGHRARQPRLRLEQLGRCTRRASGRKRVAIAAGSHRCHTPREQRSCGPHRWTDRRASLPTRIGSHAVLSSPSPICPSAMRPGFQALNSINLDIRRGEIFALLGPNGAGKTTLISIICGIVNASAGTRDGRRPRHRAGLSRRPLADRPGAAGAHDRRRSRPCGRPSSFSRGLFGKPTNPAHIEKVLKDLSLLGQEGQRDHDAVRRHEAARPDRQGAVARAADSVPRRADRGRRRRAAQGHVGGGAQAARRPASPSSSPRTTSRKPSRWPTASASSTRAR